MFAYCRNNPACRVDISGTVDMNCLDEADDDFDVTPGEDDLGYTSGGGGSQGNPLASYMADVTKSFQTPQRGVSGNGWHGDSAWRQNVQTVSSGGTNSTLRGGVPTQGQAMQLVAEAGGNYMRVEGPHCAPNPHIFPHINYVINGTKGTVQILCVEQGGVIHYDGTGWY